MRKIPQRLIVTVVLTVTPYLFIITSLCATCPVHLILLDFIILVITGEGHKSRCSSLFNYPPHPHISTPVNRSILLSIRFFKIQPLNICEIEAACGVVMKLLSDRNYYLYFCATAQHRKISDSEPI
jgi:hypothetical protein